MKQHLVINLSFFLKDGKKIPNKVGVSTTRPFLFLSICTSTSRLIGLKLFTLTHFRHSRVHTESDQLIYCLIKTCSIQFKRAL